MFVGAGVAYVTRPRSTVHEDGHRRRPELPPRQRVSEAAVHAVERRRHRRDRLPRRFRRSDRPTRTVPARRTRGRHPHRRRCGQPRRPRRDRALPRPARPRRFRFDADDNLRLSADVAVRSRRPIAVATGRGPADAMVVAVDERVEVWTAPLSWAGAFVRNGVIAPPTSAGSAAHRGSGTRAEFSGGQHESGRRHVPGRDLSRRLDDRDGGRPPTSRISRRDRERTPTRPPTRLCDLRAGGGDGQRARAAAIVQKDSNGDQRVMTFDGRTGQQLDTFEIRTAFPGNNRSADVDVSGLLVSDEAVVILRHEVDSASRSGRSRRDPPPGSQAPPRILTLQGQRPMSLTSGPDAKLYIAQPGGAITAYPVAGGDGVDVIDVGADESVTRSAPSPTAASSWSSVTARASSSCGTSRPARRSPCSPDTTPR